jgi:hypothetical protein
VLQLAQAGAPTAWRADRTNSGAPPSGQSASGHPVDPTTGDREGGGPMANPG